MSIKFSQFTNVSSISSSGYIVGYDGANNVKIKTSTSDSFLAFTGGSLQFSKLTNAMVPTSTIGINKLVNLAGLSVLGNATNASAAMAAITAANDNEVLLRSGTSLVFSKIGTDNINNAAVTFAKMQDITPQSFVGRNSFPAGPAEEVNISQALEWLSSTANTIPYRNGSAWNALTAGTNGYVLRLSGGALGFGQIDYTSVSFSATQRVLGRNSSGAGTAEELTIAQVLDWLSSTANTIAYRNNTTWTTLTAGTNGHVLRLTGGALGFGQIDYSSISFGATQRVLGRKTSGAGTSEEITASEILDFIGSTQGQVLYRGVSGWAVLSPGTSGQYLKTLGSGADPAWDTVPALSDGDKGDITVSSSGTVWTIDNKSVTYAKMQDVTATSRILGRKAAGAGVTEELTASDVLDFLGNTRGSILYRGASGWAILGPGTFGQVLQTNGASADPSWATSTSGSIGGSTGATDNSVLRADGTGGTTLQNSDISIDDATTSTQANVTIANIHSGQTNSALVLSPKGTGSLILGPKPNGAASGGNARGASAIDLQVSRTAATQIAAAPNSAILGGANNTIGVGGARSIIVGGDSNGITGATVGAEHFIGAGKSNSITSTTDQAAIVAGQSNTAVGQRSFIGAGQANRTNSAYSSIANGQYGLTNLLGQEAFSSGRLASGELGCVQRSVINAFRSALASTITNLTLDGSAPSAASRIILSTTDTTKNNRAWTFRISLIAVCTTTGGSITAGDVYGATYEGVIKRFGTTNMVGTVKTVNTWADGGFVANAPTVTITNDTGNNALDITWATNGSDPSTVVRVNASIYLTEIGW